MKGNKEQLKSIPSVDSLLNHTAIKDLITKYRHELVIKIIRKILNSEREDILNDVKTEADNQALVKKITHHFIELEKQILKPVINATGIVLHTNLGRAPMGPHVFNELGPVICNYSNLEFDLNTGKRGKRKSHFSHLITDLLDVEDFVIVNNNAAAVFLALKSIAQDKEVIVSRGELIEIGESFRLSEIMSLSGAKMIEVGSTNKTRISDYENAITPDTAVVLKTHRSNFSLHGFTDEVSFAELAALAKRRNLVSMCDLGSGLLFKQTEAPLEAEISVDEVIQQGIDLVMFSGDKLLGGPQCGIIVGRRSIISKIERHPLMRTYRVDKMTIICLTHILKSYLYSTPDELTNPTLFHLQMIKTDQILEKAESLREILIDKGFKTNVVLNKVQCGGGTLPDSFIDSYAVELVPPTIPADAIYFKLLGLDKPIVSILRRGTVIFDLFCVNQFDIRYIAESLISICKVP
jgi:L-seryl-tRNA(Ser) seleniumtransferase